MPSFIAHTTTPSPHGIITATLAPEGLTVHLLTATPPDQDLHQTITTHPTITELKTHHNLLTDTPIWLNTYTLEEPAITAQNWTTPILTGINPNTGEHLTYLAWQGRKHTLPYLRVLHHCLTHNTPNATTITTLTNAAALITNGDHAEYRYPTLLAPYLSETDWEATLPTGWHLDIQTLFREQRHTTRTATSPVEHTPKLARIQGHLGFTLTTPGQTLTDHIATTIQTVLTIALTGMTPLVQTELDTRHYLHTTYPAHLSKPRPPIRLDSTMAQHIAAILTGPDQPTYPDTPTIHYQWPTPDGHIDLLDHIAQTEPLPEPLYAYFRHFRGQTMRTKTAYDNTVLTQPVTHAPTCSVPFYTPTGNPTDSYITVSTGGAHGGIYPGLHTWDKETISTWITQNEGCPTSQRNTIDTTNAIHIDWPSFYPTLAVRLGIFHPPGATNDPYADLLTQRLTAKQDAQTNPDHPTAHQQATALKTLLNAATGAADTKKPTARLKLEHHIQSLRFIGNLLIWTLANRLTTAGARILTINTDGLYADHLTIDQATLITTQFTHDYHLPVAPEPIERIIIKDTNNRIVITHPDASPTVTGPLHHGTQPDWTPTLINRTLTCPPIVAHTAIQYIHTHPNWLSEPLNEHAITTALSNALTQTRITAWTHLIETTDNHALLIDGHPNPDPIARIALTKTGQHLATGIAKPLTKHQIFAWANSGQPLTDWANTNHLTLAGTYHRATCFTGATNTSKTRTPRWEPTNALDRMKRGDLITTSLIVHPTYRTTEPEGPVRVWTPTNQTSLPSHTGQLLNTTTNLNALTPDQLDLTAYTQWVINILTPWHTVPTKTKPTTSNPGNPVPRTISKETRRLIDHLNLWTTQKGNP